MLLILGALALVALFVLKRQEETQGTFLHDIVKGPVKRTREGLDLYDICKKQRCAYECQRGTHQMCLNCLSINCKKEAIMSGLLPNS